jgi:hypothetical protein
VIINNVFFEKDKQAILNLTPDFIKKVGTIDEIAESVIAENIKETKQVLNLTQSINAGRHIHDINQLSICLRDYLKNKNIHQYTINKNKIIFSTEFSKMCSQKLYLSGLITMNNLR